MFPTTFFFVGVGYRNNRHWPCNNYEPCVANYYIAHLTAPESELCEIHHTQLTQGPPNRSHLWVRLQVYLAAGFRLLDRFLELSVCIRRH